MVNENLVYLVGGANCDNDDDEISKEILIYDLDRPLQEPVRKVNILQGTGFDIIIPFCVLHLFLPVRT